MKVDQHYQRGICCALTESTFQQCIIILRCYFWAIISGGADFSELRPIIHVPRLSRAYLCVTQAFLLLPYLLLLALDIRHHRPEASIPEGGAPQIKILGKSILQLHKTTQKSPKCTALYVKFRISGDGALSVNWAFQSPALCAPSAKKGHCHLSTTLSTRIICVVCVDSISLFFSRTHKNDVNIERWTGSNSTQLNIFGEYCASLH